MESLRKKVRFGRIHADDITFDGAIEAIIRTAKARTGGYVVTPNVDHVCLAETDEALVDCYRDATLSLVDGKPLLWLARLMGHPLPEKISGSDLCEPLVARAAKEGLSVFFLGAGPGVAAKAAALLQARHPALKVAGVLSPPMHFEKDTVEDLKVTAMINASGADLVLVALGAPKQELWMKKHGVDLAPAVLLGIGGTLDFLAGRIQRAPRWMSDIGLEWLYRLLQEPRRMAERYLVRDRAIARIAVRMMRLPHDERVLVQVQSQRIPAPRVADVSRMIPSGNDSRT